MTDDLNESRSKRLADRMDELDINKAALAKASGASRNTIDKALAGSPTMRPATYDNLFRVLDALEADRQPGVERYEPEGALDVMTIQMTGVFGIESVTFSGPTGDAESIKQAAADFVRQVREGTPDK
jgi:transcriptional regulator with XRE-family HTH domain